MPLLSESVPFRVVTFNALGPASRHSLQFWRVAVHRRPFRNEVEAHKNCIYAAQSEDFVANLLAQLLCHRAYIQLSHKCDGPVSGGNAHSLGIDSDEHLADFVESCRTNDDHRNRIDKKRSRQILIFARNPMV